MTNKPLQALHPPVQSISDEEADREVAAICQAPEYYRVRSHVHNRCQYFMYNALDAFEETVQHKRRRYKHFEAQVPPVEH